MSDNPDRLELILKRQAALDRQMDALVQSVQSMTRLLDTQFRDVHQRLDGLEKIIRSYASEQITMADQINAQNLGSQAHRRLDEAGVS